MKNGKLFPIQRKGIIKYQTQKLELQKQLQKFFANSIQIANGKIHVGICIVRKKGKKVMFGILSRKEIIEKQT